MFLMARLVAVMTRRVSFRQYAATFAAERGCTVVRESLVGTRAIAFLSNGERWELGAILFGRFTPRDAKKVDWS